MEQSTEETEAAVRRVCDFVKAAAEKGEAVRPEQQAIYDIDYLLMEANSGASLQQYFRWASVEEIGRVVAALNAVGLPKVAALTQQAITVAFPKGLPAGDDKSGVADAWTDRQLEQLGDELFPKLEDLNGHITNVLAAYAKRVGA
jgi:hypothetical protein